MSSSIKNRISARYDNEFSGVLDKLAVIATGYYANREEADEKAAKIARQDELVDRNFRIQEIDRLRKLDPEVDHYDFGNVIYNPEDFLAYKDEVMFRTNARNKGAKYTPSGGTLSEEAEETLFTYGGNVIDYSPSVSFEEINQYEAWLFGENASGDALEIASTHNWKGLLSVDTSEESMYKGYAVLDEEEYRDLYNKGLVDYVEQFEDGMYKLDQNQIDRIQREWGYWKQGFSLQHLPQTEGEMHKMIQAHNTKIREMDAELAKDENWKNKYTSLLKWDEINTTAFGDNAEIGGILASKGQRGKYKFKYSQAVETEQPDGSIVLDYKPDTIETMSIEDFQEAFPYVYDLYNSGLQQFSDAYQYWITNKNELMLEMQQLPDVKRNFISLVSNYEDIQNQRLSEGINTTQMQFIQGNFGL